MTPAERRGALVVVFLLALGAGHDLWRTVRPLPGPASPPVTHAPAPETTVAETPSPDDGDPAAVGAGETGRLDLNQATARELDRLPGIGPVLAARIIAHRQRHGPFRSPEELLAVRGIGPRLLARVNPQVRAGAGGPSARVDTLPPVRR